jgi:hypothetical protein
MGPGERDHAVIFTVQAIDQFWLLRKLSGSSSLEAPSFDLAALDGHRLFST